MADESVVTLA